MADTTLFIYSLIAVTAAFFLILKVAKARQPDLDHIPTIGSSGQLSSNFGALRHLRHAREIIQEGCEKVRLSILAGAIFPSHYPSYYPGRIFKFPQMDRFTVVVQSSDHIEDLIKAPSDVISFKGAVTEGLQLPHTLRLLEDDHAHHISTVRSPLTRNLGIRYDAVRNEMVTAFGDVLDLQGNEWKSIPAIVSILKIVCRTSNQYFVGLPLCRNADYISLNITFTIDLVSTARKINLFPMLLKPRVGPLIQNRRVNYDRACKHLGAIISDRLKQFNENGREWPDKPNDLISWLIEEAGAKERTVDDVIKRILLINFAAIHTSSLTFTQALYDLAARPEYMQPLRDEVESVVQREGWTKAAVGQMHKVDSFIRESMRHNGFSSLPIFRKTIKRFQFFDGSVLPAGTFIAVADTIHRDETINPNPNEFKPFRYAEMREAEGEGSKHQMVSLERSNLSFGSGKHACPGRFFAATEIKTMLAHVLMNYDVKFKNEGVRPEYQWFGSARSPDRRAEVLFRKRQV